MYFTTMRPRYLTFQAESVGIPLENLLAEKAITMMRIVSPASPSNLNRFTEYVEALQETIEAHRPCRVVVDELTPLVGQTNGDDPGSALASLTEQLESEGITSLYVLGEPATPSSRKLADTFVESMTGTICLQRRSVSSAGELPGGRILITPNIGHPEGQFMAGFSLEPHKQLLMDDRSEWTRPALNAARIFWSGIGPAEEHELLPPNSSQPGNPVVTSGLCSAGEFLNELNTHLEASRSSGIPPRVVAFRVKPSERTDDLLTLGQIARAVEAVGGPGHRVCVHQNMVMAVDRNDDPRDIHALVAEHVEEAMHRISGMLIHVNQPFRDAEAFLAYVEGKFLTEELLS